MYVDDNENPLIERQPERENGSWGIQSVILHQVPDSKEKQHEVLRMDSGSFPLKKEVRVSLETGSVGTSRGVTITIGEYQTARVDVWITLPCKVEDADATFEKCEQWVNDRVKDEVTKIQQFVKQSAVKTEDKPKEEVAANG